MFVVEIEKKMKKIGKKIKWTNETVDNELLGRKKSKCCCIFVKKNHLVKVIATKVTEIVTIVVAILHLIQK